MTAISAAEKTLQAVVRNPILFAAALVIALGSGAVSASSQIPVVGVFLTFVAGVVFFFVEPFLSGGLLGMGRDALTGETTFETFTETGKRVYLRLLAARLGQLIGSLLLFGAFFLLVTVLLVGFVGVGSITSGYSDAIVAGLGVVGVVLFVGGLVVVSLIYYVIGFVIQFHPAVIVVEDAGLIESLKRSVGVVKSNLLSALGYSVLVAVVSGAIGAIPAVYITITGNVAELFAQENPEAFVGFSLLNAVIYFGLFVVTQTVLLPFVRTYHVAFYTEADEIGLKSESGTTTDTETGSDSTHSFENAT